MTSFSSSSSCSESSGAGADLFCELQLSRRIEALLVARNLRGMQQIQPHLEPGYYLRAARRLHACRGTVLIGTGFPVTDTFETDGPVGAIALYQALETLGCNPVIVCGPPVSRKLMADFQVHEIRVGAHDAADEEARQALAQYQPDLVISIERPGLAADGGYYNMRGESISGRTACFDRFIQYATCPTLAIGDGGNEIGMGCVADALQALDIIPSVTCADELLIADVSNWGVYGLVAFLGLWHRQDLLAQIDPFAILQYLSRLGSVDGVTRINTLTEDGLPPEQGADIIRQLRQLTGFLPESRLSADSLAAG